MLSVVGLFSEGEAAGAYVAELKRIGLDAKARSEIRILGPWRWLEVADAVTEERRNTLRGIEWGDAKVQVAGVPCLKARGQQWMGWVFPLRNLDRFPRIPDTRIGKFGPHSSVGRAADL